MAGNDIQLFTVPTDPDQDDIRLNGQPAGVTALNIHQVGLELWGDISTSSTELRLHQVGLEPWIAKTPELRLHQVGLEPWIAKTPELRVFQIGLEVWGDIPVVASLSRRHVQVMYL